ncbi:MAG: VWA domain-containing protein [Gammaproteobacteria bacterium]|nr:VWA domain-containing protein [Gammaproteobacteria bacterium]
MISEFHFIRVEWFWLLLPLSGLMLWWHLRKLYKGNWSRVIDPQLQAHVLTSSESKRSHWASWIYFLAVCLAITAMAGPAWQRLPMPVFKDESAMVIALDLSTSMNAQDIQPSRLQRARLKLIDILRLRRSGQSALIVYAADPYVVTPLTDDVETIIAHVPNLTTDLMPNQGSRVDRAIEKAIELLEQTGAQSGEVLLITDEADIDQLKAGQAKLRAAGHTLLVLGVGSSEGAPIPEAGGGFVHDAGGGIVIAKLNAAELRSTAPYQNLSYDDRDINSLLKQAELDPMSVRAKQTELNTDTWRDQGPWLLLPVLLLTLLGFRRGLFVLALLCLLPIPQPAQAMDWQSLWLNDNQRGVKALQEKQNEQAIELLSDPEWKAAAQYRAGQYEDALSSLQEFDNPEALYNKGNALAKLGRIPEAIAAYNKVLEKNPEHEDAKYNRDLLQQQQQQSNNSDQNSDQNQQQDSQQQSSDSQQQDTQQQSSQSQQQDSEQQNSQQQSEQQIEEQSEQQQAQTKEEKDSDNNEQQSAQQMAGEEDAEPDAEQQAIEQWLRRIPDDPGGLLRRKFLYQYRQQQSDKESKQW